MYESLLPRSPETSEDIENVGRILDERLRTLHAEQQEILSFGYSLIRQSLRRRPDGQLQGDDTDACDRSVELAGQARREILTMHPERSLTPEAIRIARRVGAGCLRRGVTVKVLAQRQALADEAVSALFAELITSGAQVRLLDGEFQRVLIADRETALVGALVEQGALADVLLSFFDLCWSKAVDAATLLDPVLLDGAHLKVLETMARADKDEVGARELGISVRTYRGRVAELLKHLQAGTRFQAALRARELGLI